MMRPLLVLGGLAVLAAVTLVASSDLFSSDQKGGSGDQGNPVVLIDTSMGKIKVELYAKKAPKTVKNFLTYVNEKFYDGTVFHRVINAFMIQGGGFTKDLKEKPTHDPIPNEAGNGLSNERGTIAMARTSDPDSATAQFYINTGKDEKGNPALDRRNAGDGVGYCVFGKVTEGMDVVNKIQRVETHVQNGMGDVPEEPVIIKSIRVVKK
jgi:peptidyl-prolyl cis-trans isomerase B (cyclophilin B)